MSRAHTTQHRITKSKKNRRSLGIPNLPTQTRQDIIRQGILLLEEIRKLIKVENLGRSTDLSNLIMPPATRKRKFSEDKEGEGKDKGGSSSAQKYYAVRKGKETGVFTDWEDCKEQITGFGGAMYKSFSTKSDAEAFVAGKNPAKLSKGDKFYAVAVGHETGVYEEWADAKKQIDGVKGPKYKKFTTREEAEEFVREGGKANKKVKTGSGKEESEKKVVKGKGKVTVEEKAQEVSKGDMIKVWTDGSSRGNGKVGAVAGYGVFFGDGDERNISAPLEGSPQTNQRAELTAALRALETVPLDKNIEIITDSNYTINCATVWYKNWGKNGWKTSTGKPVMNEDLVKQIRALIDKRTKNKAQTNLTWVKGHDENPGNVAADRLAVKGAMEKNR
ncbi:hypothetical protein ACHAQE_001804 [Botrytis cinerea]